MVARVASFEEVNVQEAERTMDEALALIRPLTENLAGYQAQIELVSSDGKVLSITFFDSDDNAQAAESTFEEEMPRRLGDIYRSWEGRRVAVGRYNVLYDSHG